MGKVLIIILSLCFLSGCAIFQSREKRSEKKLAKLLRENPNLITEDSTEQIDSIQPDSINNHIEFEHGDSTTDLNFLGLDSAKTQQINNLLKKELHAGDIDTTIESTSKAGTTKTRIIRNGNKTSVTTQVKPRQIQYTKRIVKKSIQAKSKTEQNPGILAGTVVKFAFKHADHIIYTVFFLLIIIGVKRFFKALTS